MTVAGRKEANDPFFEIKAVNLGSRDDNRHALRHKLHDFSAVGFVSKRVSPLWNHAKISVGDHLHHLVKRHPIIELDAVLQIESVHQESQRGLHVSARSSVDMELCIRHLALDL